MFNQNPKDVNFNADKYFTENKSEILYLLKKVKDFNVKEDDLSNDEYEEECCCFLSLMLFNNISKVNNVSLESLENILSSSYDGTLFEEFTNLLWTQLSLWRLVENNLVKEVSPGKYKLAD